MMPKFYFDLHTQSNVVRDLTGVDAPNEAIALANAVEVVTEMIESGAFAHVGAHRLTMRDAGGNALGDLELSIDRLH